MGWHHPRQLTFCTRPALSCIELIYLGLLCAQSLINLLQQPQQLLLLGAYRRVALLHSQACPDRLDLDLGILPPLLLRLAVLERVLSPS